MSFPTLKWNRPASHYDPAGEPEGEIDNPEDFQNHASLIILAKDGMDMLQKHYPGHLWAVQINECGHVLYVFNHALHSRWGYVLRTVEVEHDPSRRCFLRAGGEILERFGMPRGRFDVHIYAALKKDVLGQCIPVLSDKETADAKKYLRKRAIDDAIAAGEVFTDHLGRTLVRTANC
jgi:hypothetical protein